MCAQWAALFETGIDGDWIRYVNMSTVVLDKACDREDRNEPDCCMTTGGGRLVALDWFDDWQIVGALLTGTGQNPSITARSNQRPGEWTYGIIERGSLGIHNRLQGS